MRRPNPVVSMLEDYANRRGPSGPSLSQELGLSMDQGSFTMPTSLTQQSPNQTYGSQGASNTEYSRTSMPTPINVDEYMAKLFPPQAPQPQPGKWERALGGVGNAIQGFHNDMMGYPHALNSGPGGWSAIGSLVDALGRKNAPSPGNIGTPTPMDQHGQIGFMSSIAGMDPGAMMAAMGMLGGKGFPGSSTMPSAPAASHKEPDRDQYGGPSDNDADNLGSSAARSHVESMMAASPMASARPVGGFQFGGAGGLAEKLRNSSVYQPPNRSMGELMRQPDQYRPSSVPAPRVSQTVTAASLMGSRPQPVLPPQSNAVVDIMNHKSDPMKQQEMRRQLLRSLGGE